MLVNVIVKENEEKVVPVVWVSDSEETINVEAQLIGVGAKLQLLGLFLGSKNKKITCNIRIVHKAPKTFSRVNLRSVMYGHADFQNDGLVRIDRGAKNADAFYTSKVLLFDDAKGRSVPSLEIDENELKAGHASSVGRPADAEIFYLRSRGLPKEQAEKLIVSGFFEPILRELPVAEKEKIEEELMSRLHMSF